MRIALRPYLKWLHWRERHINDKNFIIILSVLTGLVVGLAAIVLKTLVHFIEHSVIRYFPRYLLFFLPLTGILLTLFLTNRVFKERSLPGGLTSILDAIACRSSRMKKSLTYSRLISSAITVGFGGSVGLEAPIVVTGSALGANLARWARLNYPLRTLLIGCGTAAAIASLFNSPIAGVVFAIEVILPEVTTSLFIPILMSAATGNLVSNLVMGSDVLFKVPRTDPYRLPDLPFFLLIGISGGMLSLYFEQTAHTVQHQLNRIKRNRWKAVVGGSLLGVIIFLFPPMYGEGYTILKNSINGQLDNLLVHVGWGSAMDQTYTLPIYLAFLMLAKPLAAALTIQAGGSGGTFGPSLVTGGILGAWFALTANLLFPGLHLSVINFTLLGMAALLAGVMHAPLTAIFLIAEITQSYTLMVPLMIVSALAYFTKAYFEPIAHHSRDLLTPQGLLHGNKDRMILHEIAITSLIEKDILTIHSEATLRDLVSVVANSHRNIYPVIDSHHTLKGIILLDDIRSIMFDVKAYDQVLVKELMHSPPAIVLHTDTMEQVMQKFDDTGAWNLPVLRQGRYRGFISKSSVFSQYRYQLQVRNELIAQQPGAARTSRKRNTFQ